MARNEELGLSGPRSLSAKYAAGTAGNKYHKTPAKSLSADADLISAGQRLRDWARWFDDSVDFISGAHDTLANLIVGRGISIEPLVRDRNGDLLASLNDRIRRVLLDETFPDCWSRDTNVAENMLSRGVQEWNVCRTWLKDGEVIARRLPYRAPRGRVPYRVQTLESDFLPYFTPGFFQRAREDRPDVVFGVEKDGWGKPVAYHLHRSHPASYYLASANTWDLVRVPAAEISHLKMTRGKLAVTRGVPLMSPGIYRIDDVADYEDAHRIGAKNGAMLLGAIIRQADLVDSYDPEADDREWEMEYGTILRDLLPGEKAEWYSPSAPNSDAVPFLDDQMRRSSSVFGIGASTYSRKYTQSYSAARQEQSEITMPTVTRLRRQFIADFVRSVEYEPALEAAITAGLIRIPRRADPDTIYTADYRGPPRPVLDDDKQASAQEKRLRAKTDSRQGVIREDGRTPSDVDTEINADPLGGME